MPLYEYQCPKCGRFELIRKFSDEALTKCPTCGSDIQKLLSAPAIQFKGTGWYITDYAKSGKSEPKSDGGKSSRSDGPASAGGKSEGGKGETSKSDAAKDAGSSSSSSESKPAASTSATTTATKDSGGKSSS